MYVVVNRSLSMSLVKVIISTFSTTTDQCTASYLRTFDGSENIEDFVFEAMSGLVTMPLVIKDISTLTFTKVDQSNSCAFHVETTNSSQPYLECADVDDANFIENGTWVADTSKGLSSCLTPVTNSSATLNVASGLYEITLQVYGIHQNNGDKVFSTYIDPKGNKIFCSVMNGDQDPNQRFQCKVTWLEQLNGNESISDFDLKYLDEYVVFEREAREFQSFHFFFYFQLHQSNYKNYHSYHKKFTRKSMLEYKLDCDKNFTHASRSNTGTLQVAVKESYVLKQRCTSTV